MSDAKKRLFDFLDKKLPADFDWEWANLSISDSGHIHVYIHSKEANEYGYEPTEKDT